MDARALTDKPLAHPVQRLQVELAVLVATNSMVARCTASAMASASR
jgi:hypothetical protein